MSERVHLLDVSGLEPCEPLERALEAVAWLQPGECLRLMHRREPYPLYELLDRQGMRYRVRDGESTPIEVLIWRDGDDAAMQTVEAIMARELPLSTCDSDLTKGSGG